jgi:hypothetical protein
MKLKLAIYISLILILLEGVATSDKITKMDKGFRIKLEKRPYHKPSLRAINVVDVEPQIGGDLNNKGIFYHIQT